MSLRIDVQEYDYRLALETARHYHISTGIPCHVIDSRGEIQKNEYEACRVCNYLYGDSTATELCRKTHLYGSYQSERFGGRYHYFCLESMLHWASPIMHEGRMIGALISGPVLLFNKDELISNIIGKKAMPQIQGISIRPNIEVTVLRQLIGNVECISPSRAHSLSEILFYTASAISDDSRQNLEINNEQLEQQSRISEYIHHIKTLEGNERSEIIYPINRERELLHLISMGDKENARAVLNEILGCVFFSSGRDFNMVKSRILELVVLLSRAALEGGADIEQIFGLNYTFLSQIHSFRNIDDLAFWLSKIMERFSDLVFELKEIKHIDVIYKAMQYINTHYMEKLTLKSVAAQIYLSPGYFSKVFRQEVGNTFSTYLNNIRISQSKILLRDRNIQLVDIAGMVGYEDQSYFTKVFKKLTGVSPGRYRESWGQYPRDNQEIHEQQSDIE